MTVWRSICFVGVSVDAARFRSGILRFQRDKRHPRITSTASIGRNAREQMVSKHSDFIGYKVYSMQRLLHRVLEISFKQYGITPGQWNLLNQLDQAGALSQRKLAEQTKKEQATITRYLDTLERKGLIVRTRDANDRRAHVITITDEARKLLHQVEPIAEEASSKLVEEISPEEIETFLHVVEKLSQNASTYISERN